MRQIRHALFVRAMGIAMVGPAFAANATTSEVRLEPVCADSGQESGIVLAIASTFASKAIDYGISALSAALKKKASDAVDIRTGAGSDVLGVVRDVDGQLELSVEKSCLIFVSGKSGNMAGLPRWFATNNKSPHVYFAASLDFLNVGQNRVAFRLVPKVLGLAPSGKAKVGQSRDVVASVKLQLPAAALAGNADKEFEVVMSPESVTVSPSLSSADGAPSRWFSLPALAQGKTPISFEVSLAITSPGSGNPLYLHLSAALDEHKTALRDEILTASRLKEKPKEATSQTATEE